MKIIDASGKLPTNPNHQWKKRSPESIIGCCWHQQLGKGSGFADLRAVASYHTGPNSHLLKGGVHSLSYTYVVLKNGDVYQTNPLEAAVWSQGDKVHPGDENVDYVSVMFQGMFSHGNNIFEEPTSEQIVAGIELWHYLREKFILDNQDLFGHYHFGKPACPGTVLQCVVEAIRANKTSMYPDIDVDDPKGIQEALKKYGSYAGKVDGLFGPVSREALKKFQQDKNLVVGPLTSYQARVLARAIV